MPEEKGDKPDEKKPDEFTPITSQEEFEKALGKRLERERGKFADYEDLKAKASKFDEAEEKNKSEIEREREARTAAEKERDAAKTEALRVAVAAEKGLSPGQAKRLVGATREDLEKDADEMLAEFGPTKKTPPETKKLKSGAKGGEDDGRGRAAAAVRQLRGNN